MEKILCGETLDFKNPKIYYVFYSPAKYDDLNPSPYFFITRAHNFLKLKSKHIFLEINENTIFLLGSKHGEVVIVYIWIITFQLDIHN